MDTARLSAMEVTPEGRELVGEAGLGISWAVGEILEPDTQNHC